DVVQRAGIAVNWRENQSGCKGVCLRVPTEVLVEAKPRAFYEIGDALDEALLRDLPDRFKALDRDGLFVLHMMGSHGPAYYKRYPAALRGVHAGLQGGAIQPLQSGANCQRL